MKEEMTMEERLIQLRKEKKLTQTQLAESIYVARQAVSSWERGETKPTQENLTSLSRVFGVSVDYLLGRAEERTPPQPPQPPQEAPSREGKPEGFEIRIQFRWLYWAAIALLAAAVLVLAILLAQARAELTERNAPIPISELPKTTIDMDDVKYFD